MSVNGTKIGDIIDPEVLSDQIGAKFPDMLVLGNSGLVEVDSTFPMGSPGTKFKIPFWKRIAAFGALVEGDPMVPGKVTAAHEYAVVMRAGAAYEVHDTADLVSKADPMAEISNQISRRAAEYIDAQLVLKVDKTPNTYDGSAGTLTPDAIIAGLVNNLGDNYAKMVANGAIIMHSKPYGDLLKLDAIQNQYQSGMDVLRTGLVPTLLGMPIYISDRVTTSTVSATAYYQTYVVGPGALALFFQRGVNVEFDRDILYQSDIVAATVHFAPHLFGWDDNSDAQVVEDKKSIHCVSVKSQ